MWYSILFWLPLFALAICVGLIALCARWGVHLTIIGAALSLVMLLFHFTYPSPDELEAHQRLLFGTSAASVDAVIISPSKTGNQSQLNLVDSPITVNDPVAIDSVIHALHSAERFSPNHPGAQWSCVLTVISENERVSVQVDDTKGARNGCLVYLQSEVTEGWAIADYRCDALGPILEKLAKTHVSQKIKMNSTTYERIVQRTRLGAAIAFAIAGIGMLVCGNLRLGYAL